MNTQLMETNKLDELIDSLNIKYEAKFVPQSQSRNQGNKDASLNWRITVNGLTTDYMQGIGHIPGYNSGVEQSGWKAEYATQVAETGKHVARLPHMRNGRVDWYKCVKSYNTSIIFREESKLPAPTLKDVLYSLVSDSDVLNYSNFEEWANDFGYETDSRRAEKIYNSCLTIALKLRSSLGEKAMKELREAFQDY